MQRHILSTTLVSTVILLLSGCGGGGGGGTTATTTPTTPTSTATTFQLTGTVPGTKIEAFCNDGSTRTVFSTDNSTSNHPFSITLPINIACQLVMTMNETDANNIVITPVAFKNGTSVQRALSGATGGESIDIGFIDLPRLYADINGDDNNNDRVKDTPLEHDISNIQGTLTLTRASNIDPDDDGLPSRYDTDDDGDGIEDNQDNDRNGNGIDDANETDTDGDGVNDNQDTDDDNDGIEDSADDDNDNASGGSAANVVDVRTAVTFALPTSYQKDTTGGRLLTAQCAQCHGTNGYSVSSIKGLAGESREIVSEISEMHVSPSTQIMIAQAKGYTLTESQAIASFLADIEKIHGGSQNGDSSSDRDGDND